MKAERERRKYRMRRLILSSVDVNAAKDGEMTAFIRPVAWNVNSINQVWERYTNRDSGSPWGRVYAEGETPDRVYSSETLVKTGHGTIAYMDGQDTKIPWRDWKGGQNRAIHQPFEFARFTASIMEIEVLRLDSIHMVEIESTGMDTEMFNKWWRLHYGKKYPLDSNPLCWLIQIGDIEWRR